MKPSKIVQKLLLNATNLDVVQELVSEDATYVSLNYDNADLQAIERWCGTHLNAGPKAIYQTFVDVNTFWEVMAFDIYVVFGGTESIKTNSHGPESKEGTDVAVFGRFKYRSRSVGRTTDSPFCVWAKVDEAAGKVTYMKFMEDTFDTAKSFRTGGRMVYASSRDGGDVTIGEN